MWIIVIIDSINGEKSVEIITCKNYKHVEKHIKKLKKEFKGYDLIDRSDYIYIDIGGNDVVEIKVFKASFNKSIFVS